MIRRLFLPTISKGIEIFNNIFDSHYYVTAKTAPAQFVGTINLTKHETILLFKMHGFTDNPLAALKSFDGRYEIASLAFRERLFSKHQIHIILFELDDDPYTTAIFAHKEYSWVRHPIKHYKVDYISNEEGVRYVRQLLRYTSREGYDKHVNEDLYTEAKTVRQLQQKGP